MNPTVEDTTAHLPQPAIGSTPGPIGAEAKGEPWELSPDEIPNVDDLVIEDGVPLDSRLIEKELRLLTETLYGSWPGPEGHTFQVLANVGLYYKYREPPLVPDVMLSLDIPTNVDLSRKENRSYFLWVLGKAPEVVIEIVSDRTGGELTHKMRTYAGIGVSYYVVFDPNKRLSDEVLRVFELRGRTYVALESAWLPEVGLGLTLWQGRYEEQEARWLRWCDQQGKVIHTGRERADQEQQRADQERLRADEAEQRAERLRAQMRAAGIEPVE
jgi:Uma2 family endonuclease